MLVCQRNFFAFNLKKNLKIRKRKDFVKASQSGLCYRSASVVVQCGFNDVGTYRVGFTASRRVGCAVVRNRCKRRMRAAAGAVFRDLGLSMVDYVLIARKSTCSTKWIDLVNEIISAVRFLNSKIKKCSAL